MSEQNEVLTVLLLGALPGGMPAAPVDPRGQMPRGAVAGQMPRGAGVPRIQTAPLALSNEPVQRGEAGPRVAKLHAELFELGFLAKPGMPPYFGVSTDAAVRNFQKAWDLVQDGLVGPETQRYIDEALRSLRAGTGSRALTYIVRQGDSLLRISQALLGDAGRWREILDFNNLTDPNRIVPGLTLRIPPRLRARQV